MPPATISSTNVPAALTKSPTTIATLLQLLSLPPATVDALQPIAHLAFGRFCDDSRQVAQGDAFILLKSQTPHANAYADYIAAVQDKAAFVLSEMAVDMPVALPVVVLPNLREILGDLARAYWFGKQSLPKIVAITGTNGKTTVSQLTAWLLTTIGQKAAVLGTAGNGFLPNLCPSTHTTLQVLQLYQSLYDFACQGATVVVLEASSHGLAQQRLQGLPIDVAVFTNLSRDHLDYHCSMEAYAGAKARLFDRVYFPQMGHAIINADDDYSPMMIERAKANAAVVWMYSAQTDNAHFFIKNTCLSVSGAQLLLYTPQGEIDAKTTLLGQFNRANLLASVACAQALGHSIAQITAAIIGVQGARGRMQRMQSAQGCFIVDYAHTPDALANVLHSIKSDGILEATGKLWVVFGCGGDRDKGKRSLMGKAATDYADVVILTSDNPRSEDPAAIIADIQAGMAADALAKIRIYVNRKQAIFYAVEHCGGDDVVVIAGKGHENYQEIAGKRYDFDDVQMVQQALTQFAK